MVRITCQKPQYISLNATKMRIGSHTLVPCIVTLLVMLAALLPSASASASTAIPAQWIAKMYTEALGRLPSQMEWNNAVTYFQTNGCSAQSLNGYATGPLFYLGGSGSEYDRLGYDNAAKLLTLYRGALNREPDPQGFNGWLTLLDSGTSWSVVVNSLFDTTAGSEFSQLVPSMCSSSNPSYYFGVQPALAIPTTPGDPGFTGTEAQLQTALNDAPPNGTIWLAQKALVVLTSPLIIPAGKTLTTYGQPSTGKYALMGRLVRNRDDKGLSLFDSPAITVTAGAKLLNVWVDGQRDAPLDFSMNSINVDIAGGTGTTVSNNKISNTAGNTSLAAEGSGSKPPAPCQSTVITGNVVTAYSSDHFLKISIEKADYPVFADGLSIACEHADVEYNQIADATDVPLIIFSTPMGQMSQLRHNTILNAGNSAGGAMGADPDATDGGTYDFTGSSIDHNMFWTGPDTRFDIGLGAGSREAFTQDQNPNTGDGASLTDNTTGILSARVGTGIAVSGMINVTVSNRTPLNFVIVTLHPDNTCPHVAVAVDPRNKYASGTFPPPENTESFDHCLLDTMP